MLSAKVTYSVLDVLVTILREYDDVVRVFQAGIFCIFVNDNIQSTLECCGCFHYPEGYTVETLGSSNAGEGCLVLVLKRKRLLPVFSADV